MQETLLDRSDHLENGWMRQRAEKKALLDRFEASGQLVVQDETFLSQTQPSRGHGTAWHGIHVMVSYCLTPEYFPARSTFQNCTTSYYGLTF